MPKTACAVQCPQCPFRSDSAPGWLGAYEAAAIPPTLWRNIPFLCHSKVDYADPRWEANAMARGKLCRGSLVFANRMRAPTRVGAYPDEEDADVLVARKAVGEDPSCDVLPVVAFVDWHRGGPTAAKTRQLPSLRAAAVAAGYRSTTPPS